MKSWPFAWMSVPDDMVPEALFVPSEGERIALGSGSRGRAPALRGLVKNSLKVAYSVGSYFSHSDMSTL